MRRCGMATALDQGLAARRAAFMKKAGQMFDRMFGEDEQHQLVTFTQREDRALELGEKLQTALLDEHLATDPLARPSAGSGVCCPDCRRPAERREAAEERELQARTGKVRWKRDLYYCRHCRRSFSPSGRIARVE